MFPFASFFGAVPDLDLWNCTEINSTICFGDGFVFEVEFEVLVVFVGGQVEAFPVVDEFVALDAPVLFDVIEALLFLFGKFFGR